MTRRFRISSLAMAGITSFGAAIALPIPAIARGDDEYANTGSLFQTFREVKPVGFKQHRSHASHASHGSHRSSSGGARPQPAPRPTTQRPTAPRPTAPSPARRESQSTSPNSVLPSSGSSSTNGGVVTQVNDIRRVQAMLAAFGYYTGTIDGLDGPMTRSAISRFQAARGLPVTGQIDDALLTALGLATN
tara:strand:- start:17423 stop:17992 length:570 start_codon:yes stop_codon:yes gene_type:complete